MDIEPGQSPEREYRAEREKGETVETLEMVRRMSERERERENRESL